MENHYSVSLGRDSARGGARFLSPNDRARHIYAIGRTGSGKTTFLRSLALQDIYAGRGVCVIDPHGDIARSLADSIPRERINDTIYFDAGDRDYPIGFNVLEGIDDPHEADLVASELITLFKGLFRESWGEWLEYLLKNAVLAVVLQRSTAVSLVSIQRMLLDDVFRERVLKRISDPVVTQFWREYFFELRKRDELERVSSSLNKVGKFALSPVVRNIIGQWRSGFDMRRVMDGKQILIANLAKGRIGSDNANFLGSLLVSKIVSTALRRSNVREAERIDFHLHIDEFQNFTSDEFTTIVSEARKYALYLTIAHQNFDQVSRRVLSQITKDAGTIAAFKVAFEDNDKLAKALHPVSAEALSGSSDGSFWARTGTGTPSLVAGYAPEELDSFRTGSFARVVNNSRWRFSRPRGAVEREFGAWYGGKRLELR